MFKRIDVAEEAIDGFSYRNQDGYDETIFIPNKWGVVKIVTQPNDSQIEVFKSDIPKLIKALQAAYDHKE